MQLRTKALLPFLSLAILIVALSFASDKFLSVSNFANVARRSAPVIIMATGMTFVIISGGIDLSVGSVLAFAGVCGTMVMSGGHSVGFGIIIAMLAGAACGLVNGCLITGLRIPPFIATLGMMSAVRGLVLMMSHEMPITDNLPESFIFLGTGTVLGFVPVPVLIMLAVVLVAGVVLHLTPLGRYTFAIGSNREAAYHSGIPVSYYLIAIYTLCGLLTGLGGIIIMGWLGSGQPTEGVGMELTVIAAVVIGGGSLSGGQGSLSGALVGALLMAVLQNGCVLLGISDNVQMIVIGSLIVAAVALDQYLRKS